MINLNCTSKLNHDHDIETLCGCYSAWSKHLWISYQICILLTQLFWSTLVHIFNVTLYTTVPVQNTIYWAAFTSTGTTQLQCITGTTVHQVVSTYIMQYPKRLCALPAKNRLSAPVSSITAILLVLIYTIIKEREVPVARHSSGRK